MLFAAFATPLTALALCAPPSHPLIAEVFYDAVGDDTGSEFVELFNPAPIPFPLLGARLEAGDGAGPDRWTLRWTGAASDTIPPGGRFVIGGVLVSPPADAQVQLDLQNGPRTVLFRRPRRRRRLRGGLRCRPGCGPRYVDERRIVGRDDRPPRARRARKLRLAYGVAAARRGCITVGSIALEAEWPEPRIQHPSHLAFFLRTFRPRRARRTPAWLALAIRRRASRLRSGRFGSIFVLEGLPQPLQFEDQRLALRPCGIAIGFGHPQSRRSFVGVHGVDHLHDGILSASDARGSAFACGGAGCVLPFAALTRANTSALGPNAINLPS